MGFISSKGLLIPTATLLLVAGLTTPALAATEAPEPASINSADAEDFVINPGPPAEPEETDLTEIKDPNTPAGGEDLPPGQPDPAPGSEYCKPGGVYRPISKGGKYHKGVGPTNSNYNGTSRTAKSRFTAEVTGTVGVSVTSGLKVKVSTMVTEIEGHFDVNLKLELQAKMGNQIEVDTPAKKTTHAKYGVYRLKNKGKSYSYYSNCSTTPKKTITSYTPYRVGWYLWES